MNLTKAQYIALSILKDTEMDKGMSCRDFAKLMWPDSLMHTKSSNTGNGATTGKAAWLCGGSYLAKLKKKKWVSNWNWHSYDYYITSEGLKQLKIYEQETV